MSEKGYWTFERVEEMLKQIMHDLDIDHLPTNTQLIDYGIYSTTLKPYGGLTNISLLTGIPLAPRPGRTKQKPHKIPKSGIAKKEAKAREKGLHYADLQKAETLRLAGRISV